MLSAVLRALSDRLVLLAVAIPIGFVIWLLVLTACLSIESAIAWLLGSPVVERGEEMTFWTSLAILTLPPGLTFYVLVRLNDLIARSRKAPEA